MTHSHNADIIIVGGGMTGLSTAIALARSGLQVAVVESTAFRDQHLPAFDGRVSAIAYGSQLFLENIGVWTALAEHAQPILDIRVVDQHSPNFVRYDHRDITDIHENSSPKPMGHIVENRYIRKALHAIAKHCPTLSFYAPARWNKVDTAEHETTVTLDNGAIIKGKFLIASDGKHSALREHFNIGCHHADYQQTAIVATIAHSQPHQGLALERFFAAGPFAVLPMQNNRSSLVWVESSEDAPLYAKLPQQDIEAEIQKRAGTHLGEITLEGELFSYPLSVRLAEHYTAPRFALLGDAAHSIHPIAGQGINLGFRDAAILAQLLIDNAKLGHDFGSEAMRHTYETQRHTDILTMTAITDQLNRLFSNDIPPLKIARNLGFRGVEKVMPLKQMLMKHAMGVSGPLPVLMQKNHCENKAA